MTYAALCVIAALVARLPRSALEALGYALGLFVGSVLRVRRVLVETAMARAGVRDPSATAARMYRNLGRGVFELLLLAGARPKERAAAVARVTMDAEAVTALDEAMARGPVLLFASHTGNWELAAAAAASVLAARGRRLAVVAKAMRARGIDTFLSRLRERLGITVVPPRGAFAAARRALGVGDVIVMPIDQVPDRLEHALPVRFLHGAALADRAPATLAWRAKATVLVVASEADRDGHRVRLLDTIAPPGDEARSRDWIDATTTRSTAALEAFVRTTPESWLWLHRRWRAPLVATAQPG